MTREQMKSHFIVHTNGQDEWIKVDKRTYDKAIDMFCDAHEAEIEGLRYTHIRSFEMKLEWETIDNYHTRAKVFGGWLVKAYECQEHASYMTDQGYWTRTQSHEMSVSMAFVPDPQHRWDTKQNTTAG